MSFQNDLKTIFESLPQTGVTSVGQNIICKMGPALCFQQDDSFGVIRLEEYVEIDCRVNDSPICKFNGDGLIDLHPDYQSRVEAFAKTISSAIRAGHLDDHFAAARQMFAHSKQADELLAQLAVKVVDA